MNWVYQHDLDPFLIEFPAFVQRTLGLAGIRWYGVAYLLGFVLGFLILRSWVNRDQLRLSREQALDFVITVAFTGVLGGRIGYVLLYGFAYFLENPLYLFKVWQGGMSIHGGIAGAVAGIVYFSHSRGVSFWSLSDIAALGTPPGLALGRIANFINGELWGRPTGGDWGVVFPRAPGDIPRHPSQLYEAVLEGPLLLVFLGWVYRRQDRPGPTSVAFLLGYGVLRFVVEFYRAPDPHLGYEWLGMTRGQEYSLLFVGLALAIGLYLRTRPRTSFLP